MKSFTLTLSALFLLLPLITLAQLNDCGNAQVVCSSDDLAFNPLGPGLNDFADPDNHPGCITALEQNSAWYYFEIDPAAPPNLVLGFIIHPKGGLGEDYDWALFGPNVSCGALGFPIRCSSSSAACGFCPDTGMGMGTTDITEGPGTGDGFVMTLVVQPGQGFYLLIDNWQGTMNGFILTWTDTAAPYLNCAATPPCALSALAGTNINACEGSSTVNLNGGSSGNHGNEIYTWSGNNGGTGFLSDPNAEDPTLDLPLGFTGTITYTLTVVEDTCMGEDQVDVIVHPLPAVSINPIGPFCANNSPVFLSGSPSGGMWGGAASGSTFNPIINGPGIHTVTYTKTDFNMCTNTASLDIEVFDLPGVSIDPSPAGFCQSDGGMTLTAEGNGGAGSYTYTWNTPAGPGDQNTYFADVPGLYVVTVTDANGCTFSSSINVSAYANPTVVITDPGPVCQDVAFVNLAADPPGGIFNGAIVSTTGEIIPGTVAAGIYTISYTYIDSHDCESTDLENITIVAIPNAIAGNNGPLCSGQQIFLTAHTDTTGNISYLWTGPNGFFSNQQNPANATQAGTYVLQVINNGCSSLPATTDVILTSPPDAVAMNNGPYCNGQNIQLFGSTSATAGIITYAWSGPNGYTSFLQNPTNATVAGTYSLIVTANQCASPPAQTQVVFSAPPNGTASNSGPYCTGDMVSLSGSTSTSGSTINYSWIGPNGYTSALQNPSGILAPGDYVLTVNVDGCNSLSDTTKVIINALPQPVISGQSDFCTGFSSVLDAGAGYADYQWSDASVNQTLEVFSSGTYTVSVTDNNGCKNETSFTVTETPSLTPVITGTLSFCEGSGTTLDAGSGYVNYAWSTGETSQTIQVTSEGNFGVIVMDADGCSGSANITTTINANPIVTIGGSTTYCIGGHTVLDAGTGYASYLWSNDSTSQIINVSTPGNYSVDVIDLNGCAGSGAVMVDVSTSLHPVITGNNAFCENGNTTLNAGSGFATYLWSDGSMAQNLFVNVAGIYSVTVSDGQGCSGDSSITINEVLPPSAVLQPSAQLCNTVAGGSVINLYDLVLSGDLNGNWDDADHSGAVGLFDNLDFKNIPAGDYHFIYTTASAINPCPEATYEVVVTIIDCTCPDVFFNNVASLCNAGDILDLTSIENTSESGTWSLIQTPAGTNPAALNGNSIDASGSDPGQYIFQFSLQNQPPPGCPVDFQIIVNVDGKVDAGVAAPPVSFCFKENQLVSLSGLITGADANGQWIETSANSSQGSAFNSNNGTFNTAAQVPEIYSFKYLLQSNGVCPDDSAEVSVVINALPVVVTPDDVQLDCTHATQSLDAGGSSTGTEYDISWTGPGILADGNEHTLHPTVDQPGNYILTITNTLTGCKQSTMVDVTQNTDIPRDAVVNSQNASCFGDQNAYIHIDQVIGGIPPFKYSVNNEPFNSNHSFDHLSPGAYLLTLEDANGCTWDTLITIAEPFEIKLNLGDDIEIDLGESANVQATINLSSDQMDTLIWTPADLVECFDLVCLEGTVHTFNSVLLKATVIDINGCQVSDDINIWVSKIRKLYIPTAFSPDNDGINDIFYIFGDNRIITGVKKFLIYNRWGDLMYEAKDFLPNDPTKGWDGSFKNQKMNPGVFIYIAEVEYIDGVVEQISGDITLLK